MRCLLGLSLLVAVTVAPSVAAEPPADWAFKPMQRVAVPKVQSAEAAHNPIDAFVIARLEAMSLRYSRPADKATLLRRVTFDLIGLPPTPEEIVAFLKDEAVDAYDKVVDRLLASPRFGERAALFWLDVVRFAESDGFKADDKRPNAWRYRDYVVKGFNDDKPFDRFVKEQIAGDELFPGDFDALVATAFMRHYPDEYNAVNLEQRRQEILNDITDTTAQTFLGLTLGCARCHDHKFDPISQRDYYRIQAFFAGWKPADLPVAPDKAVAEFREKLNAWEVKTAEVRREIAEIEKPYRLKLASKQRGRFPEEYAHLLDVPDEQRTPLEKQLGAMIEKQVNADSRGPVTGLKAEDKERVDALKKKLAEFGPRPVEPALTPAMTDVGPEAPPTYLLKRGDWKKHDVEIKPGFLLAVDDRVADVRPPASGHTTGRRSALAKWLTKPDNPLTARVIVNRLWQQHFGKGIVATPGDFGKQGDRPTHPELLDYLATELVRNGWKLKALHRQMVLSNAYRQASASEIDDPHGRTKDPENNLLWRMNRRRLDGEALRDAVLSASGLINFKQGGPSVFPELPAELKTNGWTPSADPAERNRRSIYVFVKRNLRYPLFAAFDAPDRCESCSRRFVTTTAPQALMLLNDKLYADQAARFAERVLKEVGEKPEQIIERSFEIGLGRLPTSEERDAMRTFLNKQTANGAKIKDAAADLCHALLNLNEFVYVD
jgi:hypothetical protein